jgi:hypothetical protein
MQSSMTALPMPIPLAEGLPLHSCRCACSYTAARTLLFQEEDDPELQEFEALERVLGSSSTSARSSPWPSPDKAAGPAACATAGLAHRPAQRAAAPEQAQGAAHDSDEEENWEDAPLLYGDLYSAQQQQPQAPMLARSLQQRRLSTPGSAPEVATVCAPCPVWPISCPLAVSLKQPPFGFPAVQIGCSSQLEH